MKKYLLITTSSLTIARWVAIWAFTLSAPQLASAQSLLNGQYQSSRYDLTPALPSPKVAKLGVYGDVPVDNYTGIPDIKIPLYTYQYNGLAIPVYLSYHSTGLLVDEQASEVGLGWSLHAGGVIGHTIYGSNDEYARGFGRNGEKVLLPWLNTPDKMNTFYMFSSMGQFDTEPDVYNFSYGDQSGRYVMDYQGNPRTTPFKDVQIMETGNGTTITDEQGLRYVYAGRTEVTTTLYGSYCVQPPPGTLSIDSRRSFISARYLTQVISPTRDTIRLTYIPETTITSTAPDYTMTRILSAANCQESIINNNNVPSMRLCQNALRHEGQRISTITSSNGIRVQFTYDKVNRLDCVGGHRLQAIAITDGYRTTHYDFYHSYFRATNPLSGDSLRQAGNFRLRLDSVQERGKPAYRLRYRFNPLLGFPTLGSFAQDVMGYYNGAYNQALISAEMFTAKSPLIEPAVVNGVDRRLDTTAVQQGLLARITYPTGGHSDFIYEPHDYLVDKHFTADSTKPLAYLESSVNDELFAGNQHTVRQSIRFSKPTHVRLQCNLLLPNPFVDRNGQTSAFYATLQDSASGQFLYHMPPGLSNDSIVAVPAGTFFLSAVTSDTGQKEVLLTVTATELRRYDKYVNNYPFYGCRIRSITSSGATPHGQDMQKVYRYRKSTSPIQSSGYILYKPELKYTKEHLEYKTYSFPQYDETKIYPCDYAVLAQSPINPVGTIHGGNLAYAQVQVTQKSTKADVRTDYVYSNPVDISPDVLTYPFPPPTSYDWQRGQLLQETLLVNHQGSYSPVKITRNEYSAFYDPILLGDTDNISGADAYALPAKYYHLTIIPACRAYRVLPENPLNQRGVYRGFIYYYISAFSYLKRTSETLYGPQGDSLTTYKAFTYGNSSHTQPTRIKSWSSTGDTLVNKRTYPGDYTFDATSITDSRAQGIRALQQYHITSAAIEDLYAVIHPDGSQRETSSHLAEYRLVNQAPLLHKIWEWQTGSSASFRPLWTTNTLWLADAHYLLKNEVNYKPDYSVAAIKPRAGQPTAFLRTLNKEVVAQAVNARYNQVAVTSFEPAATGRWHYDSTGTHRVAGGHTGRWAYRLDGQQAIARDQLPPGDYEVSFWVQGSVIPQFSPAPSAGLLLYLTNGHADRKGMQLLATAPGGWQHYQGRIQFTGPGTISLNTTAGGSTAVVDEVRLCPVGARLTSYTYEPLVGITSQTGADGRIMFYEYDTLSRLVRTRDEQGRIMSQQQYHYAGAK